MKNLRFHSRFSKSQRNGIFLLVSIIFLLQVFYFVITFRSSDDIVVNTQLELYNKEIDSLKREKVKGNVTITYPFNPNYITDYKGYTLGMTNDEIDRLHKFRSDNKWINSANQFQEVTKISDSLLASISPYFKFPEWVTASSDSPIKKDVNKFSNSTEKLDLNTANAQQLRYVNGIGEKLSERIIEYRNNQKEGFIDMVQLTEIYGLSDEVIEEIRKSFTIKNPPPINKIDLNRASTEQLVTIKYIDYEIAHNIIEYRTLHEGFKSLDELTKVKSFPLKKFGLIRLYLRID